ASSAHHNRATPDDDTRRHDDHDSTHHHNNNGHHNDDNDHHKHHDNDADDYHHNHHDNDDTADDHDVHQCAVRAGADPDSGAADPATADPAAAVPAAAVPAAVPVPAASAGALNGRFLDVSRVVACGHMCRGVLDQGRLVRTADLGGPGASRVEAAARRRVDRARHVALQHQPLARGVALRIGNGHR